MKSSGLVISASAARWHCIIYIDAKNLKQHGIVEYKCPFSLAEKCPSDGVPYCTPELKLKRTHHYYYQVQGCMALTTTAWCDFVIWTPRGIHVHWDAVKPKLHDFYFKAVLPELASPRHITGQTIREPSRDTGINLK